MEHFTYDNTFNEHSFSPLGLLVYRSAVCEGISKFVKIVLDYLGVECMLVSGKATNNTIQRTELHMWNIVKISGNPYHLDVTFDMSLRTRMKRYDYFNLSDSEIEKDHIITSNAPKCIKSGKDYYSANSLVVFDFKEMRGLIKNQLKSGKRHLIFKLNNDELNSRTDIVEEIIKIAIQQFQRLYIRSVSVEVSYNPSQYIYEIKFT